MKKIHILVNCFWKMSGGDRRVIELIKRWIKDLEIEIYVYAPDLFLDILYEEGIHGTVNISTEMNRAPGSNIILIYFRRTRKAIDLLGKHLSDGDIIYSTSDIMPDVVPAVYHKKRNKTLKWVTITHHINEVFYKRPGNKVINAVSCLQQKYGIDQGIKRADVYLTMPLVYEQFKAAGMLRNKIFRADNAVDIELINSSNEIVEGYDASIMCRLNPSKGIYDLPIIWKKVTLRFPKARIAVIGKGDKETINRLEKIIDDNEIKENIDILGFLDSRKAFSIIKKSKVFVFTSHEEGWGIAVAEALACGTPVVAYDLPAFKYLFDQGMTLCNINDTTAMADGINRLLSDEEYRRKTGKSGKEYVVKRYSWDRVAREEAEIIGLK